MRLLSLSTLSTFPTKEVNAPRVTRTMSPSKNSSSVGNSPPPFNQFLHSDFSDHCQLRQLTVASTRLMRLYQSTDLRGEALSSKLRFFCHRLIDNFDGGDQRIWTLCEWVGDASIVESKAWDRRRITSILIHEVVFDGVICEFGVGLHFHLFQNPRTVSANRAIAQ